MMRSNGATSDSLARRKKSPAKQDGQGGLLDVNGESSLEKEAAHTLHIERASDPEKVMRAVLGNMETSVFISDMKTDELLFVSRKLADSCPRCADFNNDCANCQKDGWERRFALCDWEIGRLPRRRDRETARWPLVRELQDSTTGEWFLVTDSEIEWIDGRPAAMQTAVKITEFKKKEEALRKNVMTDIMTGTYNRAGGYAILRDILEDDAKAGIVSSLCFMDLDGLKLVNDCYGHEAGDEFIMSFVEAVRSSSRSSDIFCRWGGDEFLLYLHDCNSTHAEKIMAKIANEFEFIREHKGRPYPHRFSFGIVAIDPDFGDPDLEQIIAAADMRMYHNKRNRQENIKAAI